MIGRTSLAALVVAALAACGGTPPRMQGTNGTVHSVRMVGSQFLPPALTIELNDTVEWTNETSEMHTVTCDTPPPGVAPFTSGDIFAGQSWRRMFDRPGRYAYYCRYHESKGMRGEIVVNARPAPGGGYPR